MSIFALIITLPIYFGAILLAGIIMDKIDPYECEALRFFVLPFIILPLLVFATILSYGLLNCFGFV